MDIRTFAGTFGVATFQKVAGIRPRRVMVQHKTLDQDGEAGSAESYATGDPRM